MKFLDRVKETTTTTGTGAFALAGAVSGFQSFAGYAVGDRVPYCVPFGVEWEVGIGTKAASSIERTTVTASSNGGALVNFSAGAKEIFVTASASALCGLLDAGDAGFDIVLCAGQSNMEGNPASDALIDVGDSRVYQWANSSADTASYRQIIAGADPLYMPSGIRTGKTGPATWFAKAYLTTRPTNRLVLLVPVAVGSTALVGSFWAAGSPGGQYYERAITDSNLAIAAALLRFPKSRFVGTIFAQGEADGLNGITQAQYAAGLKAVIAGFRSRITGAADSWFVIQAMTPEGIVNHTGEAAIHAAHQQVATETNKCAFVPPVSGMAADVHYTAPGIRIMGTRLGLAVASAVTYVGVDGLAPTAVSAAVANAAPSTIALTMSEVLDGAYVPAASAFTVSGHTVTAAAISGSTINLTVSAPFVNGEAARTVAYTQPGANNARDAAGNLLANFSALAIANNVAAVDSTAPSFVSAQVSNATPTIIAVTMSEALSGAAPAASAFTVSGGKTVSSVSITGAVISLTCSAAYAQGDTITVAYTKPGVNQLKDAANNETASFGPSAVTNSVSVSATVPAAPTIGVAVAGDGYIDVAFTRNSDGGSAVLDSTATLSTGQTATGTTSPIRVTAPNGVAATATVKDRNVVGLSAASAASNSVTPAAAGGGTTYTTFSATDKDAGLTLSNGNLTVAATAAGWKGARAATGKTTGKWYWEITMGTAGPAMLGFGVAAAPLNAFVGGDTSGHGMGYYSANGARYYKNANGATLAAFAANDVIGFKIDLDARTAEFVKNGVGQGQFTLAGAGDATSPFLTAGAVFPIVSTNASGVTVTANFGATAFAYAPPAGYVGISV